MGQEVKVSIVCKAFNQEKYIAQTLDGFVRQKTNFPFEVIIHDDASTDSTAQIIQDYTSRYPQIIRPIYQAENQYQKGVDSTLVYVIPQCRGKYLALCEGDDFWTDETKLQRQFDYLESHPDCPLVAHKTMRVFEDGSYLGPFSSIDLSTPEACHWSTEKVIRHVNDFHTSSLFFRADYYANNRDILPKITAFDYTLKIMLSTDLPGDVYIMPKVMSAYRVSAKGSWSRRIRDNNTKYEQHILRSIDTLQKIDEYRGYQYTDALQEEIIRRKFKIEVLHKNKAAWRDPQYHTMITSLSKKERIVNYMSLCMPKTFAFIHGCYQHMKKFLEH